jgi:hypothetical protein
MVQEPPDAEPWHEDRKAYPSSSGDLEHPGDAIDT